MQISDEVKAVLGAATCEGEFLTINGHIDRKLYVATNKILTLLGGKWNRGVKKHIFIGDAKSVIDDALSNGSVVDVKKENGEFFTPSALAKNVVDLACIWEGDVVLEPSAGNGAIADAIERVGGEACCYEIQPKNVEILQGKGHQVISGDFLKADPKERFDAVIMNPPFANQVDIDHVTHAMKFLKTGGKLVAIMSAGTKFRENRKAVDFRNLIEQHNGVMNDLPDESFAESGTKVKTIVLCLRKFPIA